MHRHAGSDGDFDAVNIVAFASTPKILHNSRDSRLQYGLENRRGKKLRWNYGVGQTVVEFMKYPGSRGAKAKLTTES